MTSLLSKLSTLVAGTAHAAVDAAIDLNSIPVCKQQIRDLEAARDAVRSEVASAKGQLALKISSVSQTEKDVKDKNSVIDRLLGDDDDSNDHLAEPIMAQVQSLEAELPQKQAAVDQQTSVVGKLEESLTKINARITELVDNIKLLEAADATAKANDKAADALERASKLTSYDNNVSVDNIQKRIAERNATASARLEMALSQDTSGDAADPQATAEAALQANAAKDAVAARKAALAAKKAAGSQAAE